MWAIISDNIVYDTAKEKQFGITITKFPNLDTQNKIFERGSDLKRNIVQRDSKVSEPSQEHEERTE